MARIGTNAIRHRQMSRENRKKAFGRAAHWLRKKGWKLFLVLAVVGVAVWQGWFWLRKFSPSELRTLKTVDITGNRMLTWEEILQTAGLETGMPMSEIDADSVRNRLLSLPLLQDASVSVGFFWKVEVAVKETVPLMETIENGEKKFYSERGLALPVSAVFGLPVATVSRSHDIKPLAAFLQKMRLADESLYRSVSQVSLSEKNHAVEAFFRDTRMKVLFPLEGVSERTFAHYRLLVDGLSEIMSKIRSLDMRFEGFAYAVEVK